MNFQRRCPLCNEVIFYSTKGALKAASKRDSNCRRCTSQKTGFTAKFATKGNGIGKDNPFFGKKHSNLTKEAISKANSGNKHSEESKKRLSKIFSGEKNPMFGKTVYQTWLDKYGKDEADRKQLALANKHSINNSGSGNPMYGKPAPNGAR